MLAFLLYTHSIKVLGMTRSGVFTNGIPVLTSLFSFLLLGEQLLTINYIGIAIVVGGLFLSQLRERGR
jgi:drug/metabolite transporter (DMT)-like permease